MAPSTDSRQPRIVSRLEGGVFGSASFFQAILSIASGSFLTNYYNTVFHVDVTKIGVAMTISGYITLFVDPLVGWISDATRSRFGRRRVYMAIGGIGWAWTTFLTFSPPAPFRGSEQALVMFLIVMAVPSTVFLSLFSMPYAALNLDITPSQRERVSLIALRTWCSAAGKTISPLLVKPYVGEHGFGTDYVKAIGIFAILMGIGSALPLLFCRERVQASPKKKDAPPWHAFWTGALSDPVLLCQFLGMAIVVAAYAAAAWNLGATANLLFHGSKPLALSVLTPLALALTGPMLRFFLYRAARLGLPGAKNFILVLSNGPFMCMTISSIVSVYGIMISGAMLTFLAQFHLGGREAAADILAIAFGAPLLTIPAWRWLADRIGVKRAILAYLGMIVSLFGLSYWALNPAPSGSWSLVDWKIPLPAALPWIGESLPIHYECKLSPLGLLWAVALGVANGGLMVVGAFTQPDIVDYDTWRSGERRAGIFVGVGSLINKLALGPIPILAMALLSWSGLPVGAHAKPNAVASPESVHTLRIIYAVAPVVLGLVGFLILLFFYSLTPQRMREIREELARRDSADSSIDTAPPQTPLN